MIPALTIGITTRNRREALRACLGSLSVVSALAPEVVVFDDGSDEPASLQLEGVDIGLPVRVIRDERVPGYIVGRNRIVAEARAPVVLLLDDDTRLLTLGTVERAIALLDRDPRVGAIAFAQGEPDGRPWPASMQPSPAQVPVVVPSFIGFAHLVRRDVFRSLGGYREAFRFYGEEKEFGLRLLEAGYRIVYLPDAIVTHAPDRAGRDPVRYLRFVARNDCLATLYNDPLSRVAWMLPARFALYFRMRHGWGIRDPWGWVWLAREVASSLPAVLAERRPLSRVTLRRWSELRRKPPEYTGP